jgi:hypothetical protein
MFPRLDDYASDPSPLRVAFPRSLGGREPTDYSGQSAPPEPDTAQASLL